MPETRRWAEMTRREQRALLRTRDEAALRAAMTVGEWRRSALVLVAGGLLRPAQAGQGLISGPARAGAARRQG
jgi:hypothetical protein